MTTLSVPLWQREPMSHEVMIIEELDFMAGAEERLGVLEVQMIAIKNDVQEIKSTIAAQVEEQNRYRQQESEHRHKVELTLQRLEDYQILVAKRDGMAMPQSPRTTGENEALGESVNKVMGMLPGIGKIADRSIKWIGIFVMLWLLKILTIDVDLAKLSVVAEAYQKLNTPGSVTPPAGSH